ncbi:hypothetical protein CBR_g38011 [Chara braunii]|uniref:Uncharacterized protein n=1 Tax=Chara braunii TaxID=69332 RepID=A0A388K009_CHABU|nr:hypothetical protein CBR_g38011 [Chara braunii]|eukprot:GBG63389.1 hypothetical protein CBR_g38011 [Chara braunii]
MLAPNPGSHEGSHEGAKLAPNPGSHEGSHEGAKLAPNPGSHEGSHEGAGGTIALRASMKSLEDEGRRLLTRAGHEVLRLIKNESWGIEDDQIPS